MRKIEISYEINKMELMQWSEEHFNFFREYDMGWEDILNELLTDVIGTMENEYELEYRT